MEGEKTMEKLEVTARVPAKDDAPEKSATVFVNTGATSAEMVEMFGDEAVKSNANANWVVTLQAAIRRGLNANKTPDAIQAELADAKMGVKTSLGKVDPIQASLAMFKTMSKEERKAYLADLKAAASGAAEAAA
jgi:hypothetical protein